MWYVGEVGVLCMRGGCGMLEEWVWDVGGVGVVCRRSGCGM